MNQAFHSGVIEILRLSSTNIKWVLQKLARNTANCVLFWMMQNFLHAQTPKETHHETLSDDDSFDLCSL
jgi:hypothetical protein